MGLASSSIRIYFFQLNMGGILAVAFPFELQIMEIQLNIFKQEDFHLNMVKSFQSHHLPLPRMFGSGNWVMTNSGP